MTPEEFSDATEWGMIDPGTRLIDRYGQHCVSSHEGSVCFRCVVLTSLAGKQLHKFQFMDAIDHDKFFVA